jgi:hypothetical protein
MARISRVEALVRQVSVVRLGLVGMSARREATVQKRKAAAERAVS